MLIVFLTPVKSPNSLGLGNLSFEGVCVCVIVPTVLGGFQRSVRQLVLNVWKNRQEAYIIYQDTGKVSVQLGGSELIFIVCLLYLYYLAKSLPQPLV